jgi:hypothetical protein
MATAQATRHIFVGKDGKDGKGWHLYPAAGSLVTRSVAFDRVVEVEHRDGRWVEGAKSHFSSLPQSAAKLVREELEKRKCEALSIGHRIIVTNPSHDASQSRGVSVTIWTTGEKRYTLEVTRWSRWEGDETTTVDEAEFGSLHEARSAAHDLCKTKFGDSRYV